jgi:outer membrane biosynthesis protein TonB
MIVSENTHSCHLPEAADLTRTALAIAAALLAALPFFGSAAEACISCEYVPPPAIAAQQKSPSVERSAPRRERHREASEPRERTKSRVTETAKPEKVRKVEQAPKGEQAEKVEKAETPSAEVENSSFALVTGAQPPVAAKKQTPADRGGEHSTIATAAHQGSDGAVEAANAGDSVGPASKAQGCSRYFPTVGQTIKVPCE